MLGAERVISLLICTAVNYIYIYIYILTTTAAAEHETSNEKKN